MVYSQSTVNIRSESPHNSNICSGYSALRSDIIIIIIIIIIVIIIFISRLPERHKPIELATINKVKGKVCHTPTGV